MRQLFIASTVAALAVFSGQAHAAASDVDLAKCATIAGSVERLACFDAAAAARGAAGPSVVSAEKGDWKIDTTTSKIDDSQNVMASLESEGTIPGRYGQGGPITLYVLCREKRTQFYFTFAGNFMADSSSWGDVIVRLDKAKARTINMKESTDNKALGLWEGAGVKLLKQMIGANRLFIQATPFNDNSVSGEFNLAGAGEALAPVRKNCGW